MDEFVPFGSTVYILMLGALIFGRGMDVLSTWMATPNMILEGNPIAKLLGWHWWLSVNFVFCVAVAFWPLPATILTTTGLLAASRNLRSARLMRSMGEEDYQTWH